MLRGIGYLLCLISLFSSISILFLENQNIDFLARSTSLLTIFLVATIFASRNRINKESENITANDEKEE